jgi:RimJ/RimL family protein N-acetyltransferase
MTTDVGQPTAPGRLNFCRYDERFLERSWRWLNDPEVKRLTMTPDFTRREQRLWFEHLPERTDYLIWGICEGETPIGAVGLKHLTPHRAEYWGYIGERAYWEAGLGREILSFALERARGLGLHELFLRVHKDNIRAIRLYARFGFTAVSDNDGVFLMQLCLAGAHGQ